MKVQRSSSRRLSWSVGFALALASSIGCNQEEAAEPDPGVVLDPPTTTFPLRIDVDGRTLRDADGARFTLQGEAAWSLVVQLDDAELGAYLQDRRAKGFNSIFFSAIEHRFSSQTPPWRDREGNLPFTATLDGGAPDFTQPNEAYWSHVDRILDRISAAGFFVLVFPAYVGYQLGEEGWAQVIEANGVDRCEQYGRWLGHRYGARLDLMWVLGGDWPPSFGALDVRDEVDALARGLQTTAPNQWITAHSSRDRSARDDYEADWLRVDTVYARYRPDAGGVTTPTQLVRAARETGARPYFLIEGQYENEYGMSRAGLRAQAYWSILTGAAGHFYGMNPVWGFGAGAEFADDRDLRWPDALDAPGAKDMSRVALFLSRFVDDALVPDLDGLLLVEGRGDLGDATWAACAHTPDERTVMVYTPQRRTLGLDLSAWNGGTARAVWFDPRTGEETVVASIESTAITRLTPPGDGDWVLIVRAD